jgi:hypothetical protein
MASSADSLSFADDKLKHGGYWAGDQGLVAVDRRWISQAVRDVSRILREMLAGSYSCVDTRRAGSAVTPRLVSAAHRDSRHRETAFEGLEAVNS